MNDDYIISIWNRYPETYAHKCIEEIYNNQNYQVKNFHKSDRIHEKGIDILCKKNGEKIAFSVKKKPGKNDVGQLEIFSKQSDEIQKIYVYLDHPTAPFNKEMNKHTNITFWDWNYFHKELVENSSKYYLIGYFSAHPLFDNLFNICKILYDSREARYQFQSPTHEELTFLWNIKDDAVKLKSTLNYVKNKWNNILMEKTEAEPKEYNTYINDIHLELDQINSIGGRILFESFLEMKRKFPHLLGLYWDNISQRTKWKEFTINTTNLGKMDGALMDAYIKYRWILPDIENGDYSSVMRSSYSTLYYILENTFEVANLIEYGFDWLHNKMIAPLHD